MSWDQTFLRKMNCHLILKLLLAKGPLSRVEIGNMLSMSAPTASSVILELCDQGVVKEIGMGRSSGGRQPLVYALDSMGGLAVGVDLGITWVRSAVIDLTGNILAKRRTPTPDVNYERMVKFLAQEAESVVRQSGVTLKALHGAGFGVHGLVDTTKGVVCFSPHFQWRDKSCALHLAAELGIPVSIDNDVRAMARGEGLYGAARGFSNFVTVNVGSGVGAAICTNGQILLGSTSGAGEIGHLVVDDGGVRCECGNYGCVTVMADGASIVKHATRLIMQGEISILKGEVNGDLNKVTGEMVSCAAASGDPLARRVLSDAGRYVGMALSNVINLLNPPLILLGGGVTHSGETFWNAMQRAVTSRSMATSYGGVEIKRLSLGEWAGCVGAGSLAFEPIFVSPYHPSQTAERVYQVKAKGGGIGKSLKNA